MSHFRHSVSPPMIDGAGSSIDHSVSGLLNDVLLQLVKFDFVEFQGGAKSSIFS